MHEDPVGLVEVPKINANTITAAFKELLPRLCYPWKTAVVKDTMAHLPSKGAGLGVRLRPHKKSHLL